MTIKYAHIKKNKFLFTFTLILLISALVAIFFLIPYEGGITGSVIFTAPMGGENVTAGSVLFINATYQGEDHYQLFYTTDSSKACGSLWTLIEAHPYPSDDYNDDLNYSWTTPQINSSTVRFHVEGHDSDHIVINDTCSSTFTVALPPSIPSSVVAEAKNRTAINVSWGAEFSYELVEKYLIFRNESNVANTTDNNTLYYIDTGLNVSSPYDYSVKAFNGVGESGFSSNITGTTLDSLDVLLNSPVNAYNTSNTSVTFNCTGTDDINLVNITLFGNWSGWHANETVNISGLSNSTTFTKSLSVGFYTWNCQDFDNQSNSAFANSNRTFIIDIIEPGNITNLTAQDIGESYIFWNWTNPNDADLGYIEIYRNDFFLSNVSSPTSEFNMTGLTSNTLYNISTRTVDTSGNINTTFVNKTATTLESAGNGNGDNNGGGGGGGVSITVSSPSGGETWAPGSTHSIEWTSSGVHHFEIWYSTNSGSSWILERAHSYGDSGTISYSWRLPSLESSTIRVKVDAHYENHNVAVSDTSSDFTIGTATSSDNDASGVDVEDNANVSTSSEEEIKETIVDILEELIKTIPPEEFEILEVTTKNVDIAQIKKETQKTTTDIATINTALEKTTAQKAISTLNDIKNGLKNETVKEILTDHTLSIYEITSVETGKKVYRSRITISIGGNEKTTQNITIVEVISKNVTENVNNVIFSKQPEILQEDPIVKWNFKIQKGKTYQVSYIVKKRVENVSFTTLAISTLLVEKPTQLIISKTKDIILKYKIYLILFLSLLLLITVSLIVFHKLHNKTLTNFMFKKLLGKYSMLLRSRRKTPKTSLKILQRKKEKKRRNFMFKLLGKYLMLLKSRRSRKSYTKKSKKKFMFKKLLGKYSMLLRSGRSYIKRVFHKLHNKKLTKFMFKKHFGKYSMLLRSRFIFKFRWQILDVIKK